ncbi:hypothetical protein PF007_g11827 [Phytophthora fragariae]|uniref:Uncharacterized protein n=1 Tax=Phytophthora fragariae TaxID=53985 RepID=A0A6A3S603_9STRA|nr:hypothetical protein PF007_g11827 [Phytophthora fragariae]
MIPVFLLFCKGFLLFLCLCFDVRLLRFAALAVSVLLDLARRQLPPSRFPFPI